MEEQTKLIDLLLSVAAGGLCGYVLIWIFKLRATATTLFVLTLLAICSTWLGTNCRILSIAGVMTILCNLFLQSAFFAAALILALRLSKSAHTTAQRTH